MELYSRAPTHWRFSPKAVIGAAMSMAILIFTIYLILQPQLRVLAYEVPKDAVQWLKAAPDLLPVRPAAGSNIGSLASARQQRVPEPQQFTFHHVVEGPPNDDFAVYLPYAGTDTRVFVNNVPVSAQPVEMTISALLLGEPVFVPIPGLFLNSGSNQITVISSGLLPAMRVRTIQFGPVETLRESWQFQHVMAVWMPWSIALLAATGAAVGLMATAFWTRYKTRLVPPSLLAATLALASLGPMIFIAWPATNWASLIQDLVLALASVQLLAIVPNLPGRPRGVSKPVWYLVLALLLPIPIAAGFAAVCGNECTAGTTALSQTGYVMTSLLTVTAVGLTVFANRNKLTGDTIACLGLMGLVAAGLLSAVVARVGQLGSGPGLAGETIFLTTVLLAVVGWTSYVVWLFIRESIISARTWAGMRRIVSEQEHKIRQQKLALENEVRRRAIAEERERFARDIHDGLGGTLLSLLLRIRSGKISIADISGAVESSLDDLRLMVDALDLQSRSISDALNTFHTRISPHFSMVGIKLVWLQEERLTPDIPRPETILNLFRILQEAATNIIRHAGASEARFSFSWSEADRQLLVHIADNGKRQSDQEITSLATRGGLKNMAIRTERIGGVLTIYPGDPSGWTIDLKIPVG